MTPRRLLILTTFFFFAALIGCDDWTSTTATTQTVETTSPSSSTTQTATTAMTTSTVSETSTSSISMTTTNEPIRIQFEGQNGSVVLVYELTEPGLVPEPSEPIRTGHAFRYWSTDESCASRWDFATDVASASLTIKACWRVLSYTIVFIHQGQSVGTITAPYGSPIDFPDVSVRLGYRLAGWTSNLTGRRFEGDTVPSESIVLIADIEIERYELPVVMIDLPVSIDAVGKETYVNARVTIWDKDGNALLSSVAAEFRGRGNGSWWTIDKKGYRIKFGEKQSLFGLEESKHWLLVPGTYDYGTTRNAAAYTLTNEVFDGIEYTTSVYYVDVYVNGEYYGLYNWFEKVKVEDGRVDIDSQYGLLDTGYLIEYDKYACCVEGVDSFYIPGLKYGFTVHSPDPDEYPKETTEQAFRDQVAAIKSYMTDVLNAIFRNDPTELERLVDLDSMVDFYLIHELFKNTDTGWSSVYLYKKPGGKLFFGPLWDFDFSAGVSRGESHAEGLYVADTIRYHSDFTASEIFIALMRQTWFVARVKARWLTLDQDVVIAVGRFYDKIEPYEASFARDASVWTWQFDWKAEQKRTKDWLLRRCAWLTGWASR